MFSRLILSLIFLFISTTSSAHGTGLHVLGTVVAIDATHVEVKTTKGQTVDVRVTKQTHYREKGNTKGGTLPQVGDRVVIDATKDETDQGLVAAEIHFSSAKRVPLPVPPVPSQ